MTILQIILATVGILGPILALFAWIMKLMFRAELGDFRKDLLVQLEQKYSSADVLDERFAAISTEIASSRHQVRNEMQKLVNELEREWQERLTTVQPR